MTVQDNPQRVPQPGAQDNPMLSLNLGARDITSDGWITLPKRETPNFSSAEPHQVSVGDSLYRVFGGGAKMAGAYWSPEPPSATETAAQWRSETAVKLSWNAGTKVASFTAQEAIQSWRGGIAPQQAQGEDEKAMPGWFLVGGGTQIWIPSYPKWTHATPVDDGATPWTSSSHVESIAKPDRVAVASQAGQADSQNPFGVHAHRVVALAESLREIAAALGGHDSSDQDAIYLENAANQLVATANSIFTNLVESDGDDEQVGADVGSHTGLSRHIDLEGHWTGAEAASALLDDIVVEAVSLASLS